MSDFRTAIAELGVSSDHPQDAADGLNMGNVQPRLVPSAVNYASDEAMIARAKTEVWPLVQLSRLERKQVEAGWQSIRRMSNMQHDENQMYKGRSNAYLPIHAKNIQAQTTELVRGLFPTDEYMDAQSELGDQNAALKAKHYMQFQFERQAMLRMYAKGFCRQLMDYGFSVMKAWYRKPMGYAKAKGKKVLNLDAQGLEQIAYGPEFATDVSNQGLTVSARNIFNFFAYPFTAETLRETILQFEDIRMSAMELEHFFKAGQWVNKEAMMSAPRPEDYQSDDALRFSEQGVTSMSGEASGTKLGMTRVVTECFTFMELPASEYTDSDAKGCPLPVRIVFLGTEPVLITRNLSYHQSSPFLGLSLNASPGFMLGYGPGKMIAPLQYLANDFTNQTNDVCIYGLNPIVKVIPGMLVGGLRPIAPGVTWYVNDMKAIEMVHPPVDQLQWGMNMAQWITSQAQDFGGAPPIMQGTGGKGAAKTATGAQILQRNSQQPMQDLTEDIETEILIPLAQRAWKLAQQHAPDKLMATVFGVSKEITKDDLLKEMEFRWLASSQAANAQTRAFQTTQFLQALMPFIPVLQQQGVQLNVLPVLKRIYTEALGFRGWDELMKPATPNMVPPGMAPGMGPPGPPGATAPPMPPAAPGDRPRSALEQTPGGGLDAQPGEANDFHSVRQQSDIISALQGAMGGGDTGE